MTALPRPSVAAVSQEAGAPNETEDRGLDIPETGEYEAIVPNS